MNELERVKERMSQVRLSLEAVSALDRNPKPHERPLSQMLTEWRDKPPQASPELRKQFTTSKQTETAE